MSDRDIVLVIQKLDEMLNIIRGYEGHLSGREVRVRTLLSIVRSELAQALSDSCHEQTVGTERFVEPTGEIRPRPHGGLAADPLSAAGG